MGGIAHSKASLKFSAAPALGNYLASSLHEGEAFLVEGYQNGARQHLALRQLLISLIPLRSVISRWVINESSADSVTNNSSYLFHETNSRNGRQGEAPLIRSNPLSQSRQG